MLKNYLHITFRGLWKNKGYAFVNLAGLSVGLACSMLIVLWVWDELTWDAFHENHPRLYQVERNNNTDKGVETSSATPPLLAKELQNNFPEIKYTCRTDWGEKQLLVHGETKVYQQTYFVDSTFLKMFSFRMLQGSPATALADPKSIVLTASAAKALFGSVDAMGKVIQFDNKYTKATVKVTGILADLPHNSTLQFDCIAPFSLKLMMTDWLRTAQNDWSNNVIQTFVQLQDQASVEQLNAKAGHFLATRSKGLAGRELFMHPMAQWRLYSQFEDGRPAGGLIEYVRMFAWIAGFILLIACINFMNLATARSEKRAKEVGIRKVVGSTKKELIFQFLGESNLIALLSSGLAVLLVNLLLPWFNQLTGKQLTLQWSNPIHWLAGLGITLLAGMLAGSYPAFYLSSFQPVRVLKSSLQVGKNAGLPRRILVTIQFVFSIALVISVITVYQQLQYSKNRLTGYDRNNLLMTGINAEVNKNYQALKQDMLNSGVISSVSKSSAPITNIQYMEDLIEWKGKRPDQKIFFNTLGTEYDYTRTMGIRLKQGRDFSTDFPTDSSGVLLNESAVKVMGLASPIGETIRWNNYNWHVVGILEDVIVDSPYKAVEPSVIFFIPNWVSKINIRLKDGVNVRAALAKTEQLFGKYNPEYPFDYQFVDEEYNRKFASEERIGKMAKAFAGLAILISCLGLLGLAAYTAERRTKEIGIRKVLGANVRQIVILLSREYVRLLILSMVIASPLAWYFMEKWLQNYQYRVPMHWWIFALAGLSTLVVALVTVSFQAMKAAVANPVKSLRTE